jgi:UDP-glucuronate 4-epimerase
MSRKILVTGAAGFIGFHLCQRLIDLGKEVIGLDNLNDYYDVNLKNDRLRQIEGRENFKFLKLDLADRKSISELFLREKFDIVVNLAAQAGVRYSLINPHAYIENNVTGFLNILEGCRHQQVEHLVFASSSSVYGANTKMPFSVHHNVDHPVSLYGATKKVYGPWGRPDMVLFIFTKAILEEKPIDVFNYGKMQRDFTYIDDIIEGVVRVMDRIPEPNLGWNGNTPDPSTGSGPYKLYNIGNNNPVELIRFIEVLEGCLGKKAEKNLLPMQAGDVPATYADVDDLMKDVDFKPSTPIEVGIQRFVAWYRSYY